MGSFNSVNFGTNKIQAKKRVKKSKFLWKIIISFLFNKIKSESKQKTHLKNWQIIEIHIFCPILMKLEENNHLFAQSFMRTELKLWIFYSWPIFERVLFFFLLRPYVEHLSKTSGVISFKCNITVDIPLRSKTILQWKSKIIFHWLIKIFLKDTLEK